MLEEGGPQSNMIGILIKGESLDTETTCNEDEGGGLSDAKEGQRLPENHQKLGERHGHIISHSLQRNQPY